MSQMKLSESHSLVKLTMRMMGERVIRKDLSQELSANHGVTDPKNLKTTIDAMGSEEVKELKNIQARARTDFNDKSFPWDTYRISPNHNIDAIEKISSDTKMKCEQQVELIVEKLPTWIDRQRVTLGTAFRIEDYPTADIVRSKVFVDYDIRSVPDPDHDPRAGVSTVQRERFASKIRKEEQRKVDESVVVMGVMLSKLVTDFRDRMDGYTGKKKGSFNDTIVTNLREFASKIPDFNLGNNPEIEAVRKQIMSDIALLNPDTLRVDEHVRKSASSKANDILDKVGAFGNPPPKND